MTIRMATRMNRKKRIISGILALGVLLPGICAAGCRGNNEISKKEQNTSVEEKKNNIAASIPCIDRAAGLYDISDRIIPDNYNVLFCRHMNDGKIFAAFQERSTGNIKALIYSYVEDRIICRSEGIPVDMLHEVYVCRDDSIIVLGSDDIQNTDTEAYFSLRIFIYDKNLDKINEVSGKSRGSYESYAFNEEKNELYIMSDGVAGLKIFSVDTMSTEEKNFDGEAVNMSIRGYIPGLNHLAIQYDGGDGNLCEGYIDMNTYELNRSEFYGDYGLYGNILAEYDNSGEKKNMFVWRDITTPRKKNVIYLEDAGEYSFKHVDGSGRYLFVNTYDSDNMLKYLDIYDLPACSMIGRIPGSIISGDTAAYVCDIDTGKSDTADTSGVADTPGMAVIFGSTDDKERILLCNITEMDYSDDIAAVSIYENQYDDYDVLERVIDINKRYGISIKTGPAVVKMFPDFAVFHVSDNMLTMKALDEIEKVLERCPEGFFKEFVYGDIEGIEIYLTGTLVQGAEDGISSPGGFSCICDNKNAIVMDINYCDTLAVTFSHELSHAIDKKIEYMSAVDNDFMKYDAKFESLNPEGYEYQYSYKVNGGDISSVNRPLYTPNDERAADNPDIVYFASGYGTSFPTEDRAAIFENLLGSDKDEELPGYYESINLRKKTELMFKTIRAAFNIPDGQKIYWERWW